MPPIGFKKLIAGALPGTMQDLAKKSGCAESTICRWLWRMRAAGECHVCDWVRTGGAITPRYAVGAGVDVPCKIKPYTSAEYCKAFRKRAKASGRAEVIYARRKARANADSAAKVPQGWAAALFGAARAQEAQP